MTNTPMTPETLFASYRSAVCMAALVGNFTPSRALRLAGEVFETAPAFFPEFAEALLDQPLAPQAACWSLAALLSDVPGAWELWTAARDLAMSC